MLTFGGHNIRVPDINQLIASSGFRGRDLMTRISRQTSDHRARLSWLGAQPRAPQLPSVVGSGAGHGTYHPVASGQYYDAAGRGRPRCVATRKSSPKPTLYPQRLRVPRTALGGIQSA